MRATVVLPDPDSPTMPSEPPAGTVKVTLSAAVRRPPPGRPYVLRSPSTANSGASCGTSAVIGRSSSVESGQGRGFGQSAAGRAAPVGQG